MSVTLAVAAVRLARRDTLVQQMSATESLAAVDTICIDKTGTLTSGELELIAVEPADQAHPESAQMALARFAASSGERNRTLQVIAETYPATAGKVAAEVPFSSEWKWSGLTLNGSGQGETYVLGAPDVLASQGALELPPVMRKNLDEHTRAGRRVVAFGRANGRLPSNPASEAPPRLAPLALVVLEETLRPDAAETIAFMREQKVDLKLISGDARLDRDRRRPRGRRPRGRRGDRGLRAARRQAAASPRPPSGTPSSAGSGPSRRRRWYRRWPSAAASPR